MDAYALLGVTRTASTDQIRNAYRERAMVHHPDRGGDASTWSDMQRAYDTLCDPQRRAMYDRSQPTNGSAESHFAHAFVDGEAPRKGMNIVEQMEAARQEESKSGERGALAHSSNPDECDIWRSRGTRCRTRRGLRPGCATTKASVRAPTRPAESAHGRRRSLIRSRARARA